MKRFAIAALAVLALGAVIAGAQVVTNPQIPPNTVCAYNTAPPTLTNGQASWLQCDVSGNLLTTAGGGGGSTAATIANGADVAEGSTTDAASTAGGTGTVSAKLRLVTTQLGTINTTLGTPFQAGGSIANTTFGATQGTTPWVVGGNGTAGTAAAGVLSVQGIAAMTPLLVTPAANSAVNVAQVNGVTTSTGTGAVGTGTARVAIGTDSATVAGSATLPAGTNRVGYVSDDPCAQKVKSTAAFSTSSGGPVSIVALSGSTVVYVCSISAITDTAIKLSFIDGTGGSCASNQTAIWGSTTAASGMSLAANGGFTMGNGGGTVGTTDAASAFCLLQSGTSLIAGNITYVQQ